MLEDLSDPSRFIRKMRKDIKRGPVRSGGGGGGDSDHFGEGTNSLAIGVSAQAAGSSSVGLGRGAWGLGDYAVALGPSTVVSGESAIGIGDSTSVAGDFAVALGIQATAAHEESTAIGSFSATTSTGQIMLGHSGNTVVVPGTFSNPSARRLKCNIEPAPELADVFPTLYEWEYIARPGDRRIGPMADDLVGTGAERFVVRDDDGEVAGYAKCDLHTVQIAALLSRIERLEDELRSKNG